MSTDSNTAGSLPDPHGGKVEGDSVSSPLPPGGDSVVSRVAATAPEAVDDLDGGGDSTESVPSREEAQEDAVNQLEEEAAEEEEEEESSGPVEPLEFIQEEDNPEASKNWYILKVQVNREDSIRDALQRRVKIAGLGPYFGDIVVPTEDIVEFTKTGKRRIVKRKLYPGYIVVYMAINDDTWFLVRETAGIGDFTGSAGKPAPMPSHEIEKILKSSKRVEDGAGPAKTAIPHKAGDRVRVKEGYFQNFEGDVESIDTANGRVTVMINIFGRSTPVELEHWQIEAV